MDKNLSAGKYIVIGTGISGVAAAELLLRQGASVVIYDGNEQLDRAAFAAEHPLLKDVKVLLGDVATDALRDFDVAILSPGVPLDSEIAMKLKEAGVRLSGEMELADSISKGTLIAITGTNGKTTTTTLTGEIMKLYSESVFVVGNIGIPYTSLADQTKEDSFVVAEVSSFQLETIETMAPKASAILNITPDHLNRHHTMEAYIEAKEHICTNQTAEDTCVLNYEDEVLRAFGETLSSKVVWFSSARELPEGLYVRGNEIVWAREGEITHVIHTDELNILGSHNHENVMAAVALCSAVGVPMETIRQGLKEFHAVKHRIEFVCEKRGVAFYNDSKGTNPDAAIKGIQAMNRRTVLIGGGYDKDSSYDEWIESFDGKVKRLILIGQTKEKIAECAKAHGFMDYTFAETFREAMDIAWEISEPGDAILLSPACASWGMFKNYEVRGDEFCAYALALEE